MGKKSKVVMKIETMILEETDAADKLVLKIEEMKRQLEWHRTKIDALNEVLEVDDVNINNIIKAVNT